MKPLKDYSNIKGFNYSLASIKDYDHEIEVRNMGYAETAYAQQLPSVHAYGGLEKGFGQIPQLS